MENVTKELSNELSKYGYGEEDVEDGADDGQERYIAFVENGQEQGSSIHTISAASKKGLRHSIVGLHESLMQYRGTPCFLFVWDRKENKGLEVTVNIKIEVSFR